jgi:hypothetical protein
MNQAPATTPSPGFLAALFPLTRYDDSLEVVISSDDGQLELEIRALNREPLKARGTPAALEKALPAAVTRYAQWLEAQEAAADDDVRITLPGETKAKARPARAVKRKAAPKKKAAPIRKARKAAPPKPALHRAPSARRAVPAITSGKPGKAECIADLKALRDKFGDELTRRGFIKQAKTGRRYEKLWKNWEEFTAEALGKAVADKTPAPAKPAAKVASPRKAPSPKAEKPAAPLKPGQQAPWTVKAKGKSLGVTIFEKKPGDLYTCSAGTFSVVSVDAAKREIQVEAATTATTAPAPAAKAETPPAPDPAPEQAKDDEPATTATETT